MILSGQNKDIIDLSLIDLAIKEKRIHIFKNVLTETPEWDELLALLSHYISKDMADYPDETLLKSHDINSPYLSTQLRCRFWSRLTFQLCGWDRKDPIEEMVPSVMPLLDWTKKIYGKRFRSLFILVSLMKNKGDIGNQHIDEIDQFQWQCQGKSIWRTGDSLENEYIIEPGDLIFIPKKLSHEVETLIAPRASVNILLHNEEDIKN